MGSINSCKQKKLEYEFKFFLGLCLRHKVPERFIFVWFENAIPLLLNKSSDTNPRIKTVNNVQPKKLLYFCLELSRYNTNIN